MVGKSDDGLLYKLRHCQTGKPQRSQIHANRLKLCNEDRDIFYAKNKIVSEGVSDDQTRRRPDSTHCYNTPYGGVSNFLMPMTDLPEIGFKNWYQFLTRLSCNLIQNFSGISFW